MHVSRCALDLGLEVWFSPALFDKSPAETLRYIIDAARVAESVRNATDAKLVFCIGQELMLFMRGILPGRNLLERFDNPANRQMIRAGKHRAPLNAFLGERNRSRATRLPRADCLRLAPLRGSGMGLVTTWWASTTTGTNDSGIGTSRCFTRSLLRASRSS